MYNKIMNMSGFEPVHMYDLFDRIQEVTNGDMYLLFNKVRGTYELHSDKSLAYNGYSINCVIDEERINGWLVTDMLANLNEKFGRDIIEERDIYNARLDNDSDRGLELLSERAIKTVEKMVGREI